MSHFSIWFVFDMVFNVAWMVEDVAERPYITVGMAALLLLFPLALTSTKGWIRRLGRRWAKLHRLVYVATGLGIVHYYWLVKSDVRLPLLLAACFGLLMVARAPGVGRSVSKRGVKRGAERDTEPSSA